jgi:pullulanase
MDKLANAIVLTSQGTAFIHAGSEMLRTKQGEHNSYNLPDSINQINWNWKSANSEVVTYYKNLIALRKAHPAFHMASAEAIVKNLEFKTVENGFISYEIHNNANGDSWNTILVIYNAQDKPYNYKLDSEWQLAVKGDNFTLKDGAKISTAVIVPPLSLLVAYKK